MPRFVRVVSVFVFALALVAPVAWAQSQATTGVIEGTVRDADGGVVPGATVTLLNTDTNFTKISVTDGNGRFRGQLLPLGPYRVTVELEGLGTVVQEGVTLALGQTVNLSITMAVSETREEIVVTADAPLIETTRSSSLIRIDDMAVEGLPNNGRNFLEFSKLTPGVTVVQGPDGDELSINGQKGINNNVMIDGADFNNPFFGEQRGGQRPAFTFNQDAVKEVLVVPDGAPAEFGRSSGGFVSVVTKSGTNDLKGSAHFFFQDDSLSDDPQLRSGGTDKFDFERTQVGFTLGGPVRSDKAFFFLAADVQDKDETKQTDPGRIAPDVVAFLNSVGLPNESAPIVRTDDGDAYLAKLDYQASDNNLLTLRWAYHFSEQVNGTFDVPSWGVSANGIETDYAHGYTGSFISTVSDTLLNELRAQYAKEWRPRPYDGPQIPGQNRPFPDTAFDFVGGYRVGMPFFLPVVYDDERVQLNDNVSILKGNHSIKAGIEYNDVVSSQTFIGFANGRYIFDSFDGFRNYVNFGPGWGRCSGGGTTTTGSCPNGESFSGPLLLFLQQAGVGGRTVEEAGTQNIDQIETALFIQDTWKPTANLTVDYGLRWEMLDNAEPITPPSEVFYAPLIGRTIDTPAGPQTFPSDGTIPDDENQIQPRFAMAWTPKGASNQVVRFNSGIYHARIPALALASARSTNGSVGQTIFRASFFNDFGVTPPAWPNLLPADAIGDPFNPDVFVFSEDFETPRTWSTALSWEKEIAPSYALLLKANYAKTDHITRWVNRNDGLLGPTATAGGPGPWSGVLPGGNGIGALNTVESTARSRYWGLTVGINKRMTERLAFQAYYTNSEDKSDDDNERDPFTIRYANVTNLGPEFGLSDRHQRNRINAWLLWAGPIDVNVRATFLDAQPADINPDGSSVAGFPPSSRCVGGCTLNGDVFTRNQGEKDNEFSTIDVRVSKDFEIGNTTVQPIFEVFNLLDEENFLVPETTSLIFNFDGTVRSGAGEPRKFQIGARFLW